MPNIASPNAVPRSEHRARNLRLRTQNSELRTPNSEPEPRTVNPEPGTRNPEPAPGERDTPMTATYIRVLVLEAAILVALWLFARAFS
jgi:hypothetical protein